MSIELAIEIIGAIVGLTYLYLEYKASFWLWTAGIIMSLFYIYIYFNGKFYADMGINIYYLGANLYGLFFWKRQQKRQIESGEQQTSGGFSLLNKKLIFPLSGIFLVLFSIIFAILHFLTDSPVALGDSFTTSLSIIAMWLMARKHPEHWLLWIVINFTSTLLYLWKGLYPTSILFVVYTVVSVMGYFKWKRLV